MANDLGDIRAVGIDVDLSGLKTGMQQAADAVKKSSKEMQTALLQSVQNIESSLNRGEIERGLEKIAAAQKAAAAAATAASAKQAAAAKEIENATKQISRGLSLYVSLPMAAAGVASVKMAADMETTKIAFTTLLGSAKAAQDQLDKMKDFAAKTPFQFTDLTVAAKRMMAYGFSAQQVLPMMRTLGDAMSALGTGNEGIDRMTVALGQMQAKGRVMTQEMNQITETGVSAWKYLADSLHVSMSEAMDMVERRMVTSQQGISAILEGMGNDPKFKNGMQNQMDSINGAFSNFKDNLTFAAADLGQNIANSINLKSAFNSVTDGLGSLTKAFSGLNPNVKTFVTFAGIAVAATGPLIVAIYSLKTALTALQLSFAPFLIGGAILLGLAAIAAIFVNIKNRAKDAMTEIANITVLTEAVKKQKEYAEELKRLQEQKEKINAMEKRQGGEEAVGQSASGKNVVQKIKDATAAYDALGKKIKEIQSGGTAAATVAPAKVETGGAPGRGKGQQDDYEKAKSLYEQDAAAYGITISEKIAKYNEYLGSYDAKTKEYSQKVKMTDEETAEFEKGLIELETEQKKQSADVAKINNDSELQSKLNDLDEEKDAIRSHSDGNILTREQEMYKINEIDQQAYELKRAVLTAQEDDFKTAASKETVEYAQLKAKEKAMDDERNNQYKQYLNKQENDTKTIWDKIRDTITEASQMIAQSLSSNFQTALEQMENGTYKWKDILSNTWSTLKSTFASVVNKMVADYLAGQIAHRMADSATTLVNKAQAKTQSSIVAASSVAAATAMVETSAAAYEGTLGMLQSMTTAIGAIWPAGTALAAAMEVGIVSAQAGIVGSSAAATAAIAGIGAGAAGISAFDVGSWEVPSDQLANIHQGETIVPKNFAEKLRETGSMTGNSNGGDTHFHIHAVDAKSVQKLFLDNKESLITAMKSAQRNFF
ncbi:MAG TPA: hypothetical protein DDW50_04340 [Firmicutes bacterium]|jgi:tape measure domain-containing protein|nr:hypothetical protein [Bacillota bacterium]